MTLDVVLRTALVLLIMGTCFGWWMSIRFHKPIWLAAADRRALLVSWGVLQLMVVNGAGVVYAATKGYPLTVITGAYLWSFAGLNVLMYIPLRRDPTVPARRATDRH